MFIISLAACMLVRVHCDSPSASWCYHKPSCSEVTWSTMANSSCNGTQQSPINIVTANVQANADLTPFTFTGYNDTTALTEIKNSGTSIEVALDYNKTRVAGGDLPGLFASTQFHLHWGNTGAMPGSEHTVDGNQYPMELHIVNRAVKASGGSEFAVLGVFIEASNENGKPESWKALTSYLPRIANAGSKAPIFHDISLDDLLPGLDRTKYYRYLGSLTTPDCSEGVLWTIFKDPVKVSQDLIDLFSTTVYVNATSNSPLMTGTFRRVQPLNGRIVTSQVAGTKNSGPINPTSAATNQFQFLLSPLLSLALLYCISLY